MPRRKRRGVMVKPPWLAVSQERQERLAKDTQVRSTAVRIFAAAQARLTEDGHAHFARGELREWMSLLDRATGEVQPMSADNLRRQIDALVSDGVLGGASWSECLRLNLLHFDAASSPRERDCPDKPTGRAGSVVKAA
jgi:hypothetical protein